MTEKKIQERLESLMRDNPRLTVSEYAKLAVDYGLGEAADPDYLRAEFFKRLIRSVARRSKDDPQMAFVSIMQPDDSGNLEKVYVPAIECNEAEAQQVVDDFCHQSRALHARAEAFYRLWTSPAFGYQLNLPWGD